MQLLKTVAEARAWRRTRSRVALVPTMGNLHAGHLELVSAARGQADNVIVSIFVNPLQFGPNEDLANYPRTFEADIAALEHAGVTAVFAPGVDEMYPAGGHSATTVHVAGITEMLCGASRPGHFDGVATVVSKLFNMLTPDIALFGEKDYQQLAVIRQMAEDLALPVEVVGVPTVREDDGLAYSSRNGYLTPDERRRAVALSAAIDDVAARLAAGQHDYRALEARGWAQLTDAGFDPDYFDIRDARLAPATEQTAVFRVLAAGRLGRTRLIGNKGVAAPR